MAETDLGTEWRIAWATPEPHGDGYTDNLVLNREQAIEYGNDLVQSLRIDGEVLRKWGLDPEDPFAWAIRDGEVITKQVPRKAVEAVAESDRADAFYARRILKDRAKRRLRDLS